MPLHPKRPYFKSKVRLLFFILAGLTLFTPNAFSSQANLLIDKANELGLSEDPFWRNLLHFKGKRSKILDDDFFLSETGKVDPHAELEATIKAYFLKDQPVKKEGGDNNVVCLFPARYTWLNEKLGLPGFKIDGGNCPALTDWAQLDRVEAVSVLYVSGYLGNPASSFGHVLLNLKLKGSDELYGLLDTSVAYGATVPLNENMLFYVLKGLFGGYYASFSDKFFYAHDQVYTNREFRDIWEYTLELTDFKKKLLIYHIAELLTKRYRYFFLSSNCAQRMAVLLDIFIDEPVYDFDYPIYVPEELFHRLQHIDESQKEKGRPGLIKSVKYIPSARHHLYYQAAGLDANERKVYREIAGSNDQAISRRLEGLEVENRIRVLNALLAYQYYKLMASDDSNPDQALKEYKDKILLERLRLPAKEEEPVDIPEIPSPKDVSPPSAFSAGYVVEDGVNPFETLGVTIFRKESVGLNALGFNELVALDLNIGFADGRDAVFVDSFDFLKIRDFRTFYIEEAGENPLSWRVRAGVDRFTIEDNVSYDYVFDAGIGLVSKIKTIGIVYGFLNASSHSLDQQYRSGPSVGFIIGNDTLKLQTDFGLEFGLEDFGYTETFQSKLQYQVNRHNALQLSYEKNLRQRLTLNYIFYW